VTAERLEVQRTIAASPADIFRVLCDPQGHVAIDSSGMLMDATGEPVTGELVVLCAERTPRPGPGAGASRWWGRVCR
jgi:hypothetical protein